MSETEIKIYSIVFENNTQLFCDITLFKILKSILIVNIYYVFAVGRIKRQTFYIKNKPSKGALHSCRKIHKGVFVREKTYLQMPYFSVLRLKGNAI